MKPSLSGVVALYIRRRALRLGLDDRVPSDVRPYVDELTDLLQSGQWRNIGEVVVYWDDALVMGSARDGYTLYAFRRVPLRIFNGGRSTSVVPEGSEVEFGSTVTVPIRYPVRHHDVPSFPAETVGEVTVTQLFRQMNEHKYGIRPGHVGEIVSDPDGHTVSEIEGCQFHLFTRKVVGGRGPYVVLLLAIRRGEQPLEVVAGFTVYGSHEWVQSVSTDPWIVFGVVLELFGKPVTVGGRTALFFESAAVAKRAGETQRLVEVPGLETGSLYVTVRDAGGEEQETHLFWVFAIDQQRYEETIAVWRGAG